MAIESRRTGRLHSQNGSLSEGSGGRAYCCAKAAAILRQNTTYHTCPITSFL